MRARKTGRLLVEERRRRIRELIEKNERATVEELVERFGVSAVTIRGDLDALAEAGVLVRSHGGALRRDDGLDDIPIPVKETLRHPEKVRIAQAAVKLIQDGETILLDSGTTTAEIARQIKFRRFDSLTVITNALNVAMELATVPAVRVIMVGRRAAPHVLLALGAAGRADAARPARRPAVPGRRRHRSRDRPDDARPARGPAQRGHDPDRARGRGGGRLEQVRAPQRVGDRQAGRVQRVITDSGAPKAVLDALRARGIDVIVV